MSRPAWGLPHLSRYAILVAVLPAWCFALVALRFLRSGQPAFRFLVWNLALALVPVVAAGMLVRAERRHAHPLVRLGWFTLWLLFLPNAPYIVTDFVHLHPRPPIALWYDIALIVSFAGTGLILCYASMADVQGVVSRRFGTAAGWAAAVLAMLLSGFGIYLGRFLRWNSWDTLVRPGEIAAQVLQRALAPPIASRGLLVTLVYGTGLALGYAAARRIAPHAEPHP
jgi:uncharacterized membrane protein